MLTWLGERGWAWAQQVGTHLPFTYWHVVWRSIDGRTRSILDVGCADGDMMAFLNHRRRYYAVGVDIFEPYLKTAKRLERHSGYVRADALRLPFRTRSFDTVLFLETIEHLEREEGSQALQEVERVARWQVVVSTPVAFVPQGAYGGNPNQKHRSFWTPHEMRRRGYTVRGIGIADNWLVGKVRNGLPQLLDRVVRGREERAERHAITHSLKLADFLLRLPYYLLPGPLVGVLPQFAGHMVCAKRLE